MRYILDTDGYVAYASVENEITCDGESCVLYSGTIPEGYTSIEDWMSEANINAYKIVDGNLVLDSARLAYLEAKEKSEENDNRHVTAKELYDIINVQSSVTEEDFTAQIKGSNLLVIDGAGEQVIPRMTIKKGVNWNDISNKTWNELGGITQPSNKVLTSVDVNGNLYNGKGYKIGYRLNSSGNEVAASSNVILSGFIPYTPSIGDVIRWKVDSPVSTSSAEYFSCYDANHTKILSIYASSLGGSYTTTVDGTYILPIDSGRFAELGNTAYIRVSRESTEPFTDETATGFIVTLNEEITDTEEEPSTDAVTWGTIGKGTDTVSQVEIISSNKNILPCLVPSQTLNGVTITQNEDYSFTLDGTSTADTEITLAGTTLSTEALFCMRLGTEFVKSGLGNLFLKLYDYDGTDRTLVHTGGNGTITPTETYRVTHATLVIPNGTTLSNVTISPQIEVGSTETEYIPNKRDYKKIDVSMDSGDILTIDNGTVSLNNTVIDYGSNVKTFKDKCVLMVSANSFVDASYYLSSLSEVFKRIKLSADQINLEGYTTINDGFAIDEEGNVTAKSGTIGGWNISDSDFNKSGKCMINNASCNYEMKIRRPHGFASAISITTDYNGGTTFDIFPSGLQMSRLLDSITTFSSLSGTTLRIGNRKYTSLLDCQPNGAIFYVGDINGTNQILFDANATTKFHVKGGNALADNGSWVNGSLESRKKEIEEYRSKALEIVKSNKIYSYLYNAEDDDSNKHYGFVIPSDKNSKYKAPSECISSEGDGIDTYSMCAILWKAVQELSTEVEQLKGDKNNG